MKTYILFGIGTLLWSVSVILIVGCIILIREYIDERNER